MAGSQAPARSVCTACPMLCDDVVHTVSSAQHACEFGSQAFASAKQTSTAIEAWENGTAISGDQALNRAADLLLTARRVLVTGLAGATLEALSRACDVADNLGAAVDAGSGETSCLAGPAVARVGEVTAAWEEVRDRADLVIFWFCDPTATHPRFLERFILQPTSDTKHTIAIGGDGVLPPHAGHRHLPLPHPVCIWAARLLQARLLGQATEKTVNFDAPLVTAIDVLHEAILAANCVAIITSHAAPSAADPAGLEAWSVAHLVRCLAHLKPAFEIPLGAGTQAAGANGSGAAAVCTWRYRAPGAIVRADRWGSVFSPGEADALSLVRRGEVDCVLAVGPLESPLEAAILERGHALAIVRISDANTCAKTTSGTAIQLRCANGMMATTGTMLREDGRQIAVEKQLTDSAPQMDALLSELVMRTAEAHTLSSVPMATPGTRARSAATDTRTRASNLPPETDSCFVLSGGTLYDPANNRDGVRADIWVENGTIITPPANSSRFVKISAAGLVVMPGGVDLHSHVAGAKVGAGRRIAPQLARGRLAAVPTIAATGALYAALGYTTVFDAAIATSAAGIAHRELNDLPILDKGIYLLAADETAVLAALVKNDDALVQRLLAHTITHGRGWAVKVANPGGSVFWKHGRRGDHHDLDAALPHAESCTPRLLLERLARAVEVIGLPHPLHVHTANLGLPGNWRTLLETMRTFDGIRAHLAHVQFHSYTGGDLDPDTFGSGVGPLVEWFNAHEELTLDVGQVLFGDTVAMTGDSAAAEHLAHTTGVPWMSHDLYLEGGCGVLPISYREKSLIHAWQWAIGLEWFLTVRDPWRLVLSTDHPNGAHFSAYPLLMQLLGDEAFRREAFARIHPAVRKRSPLAGLRREYSLQELCIVTRAAPARIAGLPNKGHLGIGADADITLYRPDPNLARMFSMPAQVFKNGVLVAENGHVRACPNGRTLTATL